MEQTPTAVDGTQEGVGKKFLSAIILTIILAFYHGGFILRLIYLLVKIVSELFGLIQKASNKQKLKQKP